jgi:putative acetyltransferase
MSVIYREIAPNDNEAIAKVIKTTFEEFGIDKPGTVYTDPTTTTLYQLFQMPKSIYWIAEENNVIIGGCGIFPTKELPVGYAELVKFYVSNASRGKGIGNALMQKSLTSAKAMGYTHLYLETFGILEKAVSLYIRNGFTPLPAPLGNSGHYACTIWMKCRL